MKRFVWAVITIMTSGAVKFAGCATAGGQEWWLYCKINGRWYKIITDTEFIHIIYRNVGYLSKGIKFRAALQLPNKQDIATMHNIQL